MRNILYAFYGDDFTGSTDVLEQLAEGGVPAVLFLRTPDADLRARFPDARAIGLAGDSRSQSPQWMEEQLPAIYRALSASGAPIVHYKTCSTFDSSPETGSIGRAMEIAARALGGLIPIIVGAPHLRRYVAFGNLFAAAGEQVFRIDRHPTMARHPVTPMREADLRLHLAAQTGIPVGLVPLDRIQAGEAEQAFEEAVRGGARALLFDGVDEQTLGATGALLRRMGGGRIRFAVGSSGVTRALVSAWREEGTVAPLAGAPRAAAVDRLLVVSGSCSPATAAQIAWSGGNGFACVRADVGALLSGSEAEIERLTETAIVVLGAGGRCVIHSAEGPLGEGASAGGAALGAALGRIARQATERTGLSRLLFAGGDTSSHAVAQLGVDALRWAAPLERGAPLCRAYAGAAALDGLELVLKGGQIGGPDFFETVRRGG